MSDLIEWPVDSFYSKEVDLGNCLVFMELEVKELH